MNLPSIDKIVCDLSMLKLFHDFYIGRILESLAISYPILNRNNYHLNPLSSPNPCRIGPDPITQGFNSYLVGSSSVDDSLADC